MPEPTVLPIGSSEPAPELEAVRQQLLVFAREIKSIYRQERERTKELENVLGQLNSAYLATMKTLAFVVEAKDLTTRGHLDRTHRYATALTRLVAPDLENRLQLEYGFLLHDIGKVGVPERILGKAGELSPDEWEVMKTHPVVGAQIVAPMDFLGDAVQVILHHHERFDGEGYPRGLAGTDIPIGARIFSVVDAFDAMTSDRPYRKALSASEAMDRIQDASGTQFDPEVVEAFAILLDRMDGLATANPPTLRLAN